MSSAYRSNAHSNYSGSASPLVINKPSGTIDGDVLVAAFLGSDTGSVSTLSGWTSVFTSSTGFGKRRSLFYKVASGEGASYSWVSSCADLAGGIICVSGTTGAKDASATNTQLGSGSPTCSFTTGYDNETVVWTLFRNTDNDNTGVPSSLTSRLIEYAGPTILDPQLRMATGQFATAGALTAGYKTGSFSGDDNVADYTVAIITFVPGAEPSVKNALLLGAL